MSKTPTYEAAMILYVLWRDTSPNEPEKGLTVEEITERCNQLTKEELETVDTMWRNMCEDQRNGKLGLD